MRKTALFTLLLTTITCSVLQADTTQPAEVSPSQEGTLQLFFEPNLGQSAEQVEFLTRGPGYSAFFTRDGMVMVLYEIVDDATALPTVPGGKPQRRVGRTQVLRLRTLGGTAQPAVHGLDRIEGSSTYLNLAGGGTQVHDVPHFARLRYDGVYPGIDQAFYSRGGQLEYDFVVAPHADPADIELAFDGAESLEIDAAGNLLVHTALGTVMQPAPVLYQDVDGDRRQVDGGFRLLAEPGTVGFEVASFDPARPLVIDPQIVYRTCLGGSGYDWGRTVTVTDNGQAYVAGTTYSADFPTTASTVQPSDLDPPVYDPYGNVIYPGIDVFVAKLDLSGSQIVHATYLGLQEEDRAYGIDLDASRNVYVGGSTGDKAYVLKMDSTLSTLFWSKIFGGSNTQAVLDLVVNDAGDSFAAGSTTSANFCTTSPFTGCTIDGSLNGAYDAFLVKLNRHGAVRFVTLLGNGSDEFVTGVDVDGSDRVYVAGSRVLTNNVIKGFLYRVANWGGQLEYAYELNGEPLVSDVAVDDLNQAYLTGRTTSTSFYTTNGTTNAGWTDGFVTVLNSSGNCCVYSTLFGDGRWDESNGIAVDYARRATIVGNRAPVVGGVIQQQSQDVWVVRFGTSGQILSQQVFGGSDFDTGEAVALDSSTNVFISGTTHSSNFNPSSPSCTGVGGTYDDDDAYVAKLRM